MAQVKVTLKKPLFCGCKHGYGQKRGLKTIILGAGFHTFQAHHAIILHHVFMLNIVGYGFYSHITHPVAIATSGTVFALFV